MRPFKSGIYLAASIGVCVSMSIARAELVIRDGKTCWDGICGPTSVIGPENDAPRRPAPIGRVYKSNAGFVAKPAAQAPISARTHVAIQVSQDDKATMDLALNNARNILDAAKSAGRAITVEIVAFGPGLHMFRADTSPVKDRLAPMSREHPALRFAACGKTLAVQSHAEGRSVALVREANVTPSGAVRLIELQELGYAYVRP